MILNAITQAESNTGGIAFQIEEARGRVMFLDFWETILGVICSGGEVECFLFLSPVHR